MASREEENSNANTPLPRLQLFDALANANFGSSERWLFDFAPYYYLALIALAELTTVTVSPELGLGLHAMMLLLLPLHYALARARDNPVAPLILTLTLGPLIRIMSLSLPLTALPSLTWYVIIAMPLFAAAFALARTLGMTWRDAAMTIKLKQLPVQLLIASTGLILGLMEFLILRPQSLVPDGRADMVFFAAISLIIGTGLLEEVIFRGVMQHTSLQAMGARGLIYSSLVFMALHIGYLSILDLLFVFSVGLYFAWIVRRTGSLLGVVIAHSLTNIVLYLVMPAMGAAFLSHL